MGEVGGKSRLDDSLKLDIRKLILRGEQKKDVARILGIPEGTWDYWIWNDSQGLRKDIVEWEKERLIAIAKGNLDVLLKADDDRIKADMTKYTLDRLDKGFSPKQELTGKDGEPITFKWQNENTTNTGG